MLPVRGRGVRIKIEESISAHRSKDEVIEGLFNAFRMNRLSIDSEHSPIEQNVADRTARFIIRRKIRELIWTTECLMSSGEVRVVSRIASGETPSYSPYSTVYVGFMVFCAFKDSLKHPI